MVRGLYSEADSQKVMMDMRRRGGDDDGKERGGNGEEFEECARNSFDA